MLNIITNPNPNLRLRSKEITVKELEDVGLQKLIDDMIPTMHDDDGVGLAAPQIDQQIRLVIIGKEAFKKTGMPVQDMALINPEFSPTSDKKEWEQEGCLSVPGVFGNVERFVEGTVNALDRHGNSMEFSANKFLARVIQHEIDHLDGILFIDKASDIVEAGIHDSNAL